MIIINHFGDKVQFYFVRQKVQRECSPDKPRSSRSYTCTQLPCQSCLWFPINNQSTCTRLFT